VVIQPGKPILGETRPSLWLDGGLMGYPNLTGWQGGNKEGNARRVAPGDTGEISEAAR